MGTRKQAEQAQKAAAERYEKTLAMHTRGAKAFERAVCDHKRQTADARTELERFVTVVSAFYPVDVRAADGAAAPRVGPVDAPTLQNPGSAVGYAVTSSACGGVLGAAAAAGTYGAVGTFGTASTGTAIAALNGVAASNATLAAIGSGSLATGGGGIAAGTAILSGVVLAPLAIVGVGVFIHLDKKATAKRWTNTAELEGATLKLRPDSLRLTRLRLLTGRLSAAATLLGVALAERSDELETWPADVRAATATNAQTAFLARTIALAGALAAVLSATPWSENGNPSDSAHRAAREAEEALGAHR